MPDNIVCVDGASLVVGIGGRGGVRMRLYVLDESSAEVGVVDDLKWSRFYDDRRGKGRAQVVLQHANGVWAEDGDFCPVEGLLKT